MGRQRWFGILVIGALVGAGLAAVPAPSGATGGPEITVSDATVTEGDSGAPTIKVAVDLSVAATAAVKVPYAVVPADDGTTDAADAVVKLGTLAFPIGVTSKPITVTVVGDTTIEPDQHFTVVLGTPTGPATVTKAIGTVTILDDDSDGINATLEASVGQITVEEADGGTHTAWLPITLSRPAATTVKVGYRIGCSTATVGADASLTTSGTVTFLAGQQVKLIAVKITPDVTPEDLEALAESLLAKTGNVVVVHPAGSITIVDDDPGSVPVDPLDVGETEQVSVESDGTLPLYPAYLYGDGGHGSTWASISNDGRSVAFVSDACTLVPGDNNGERDIFVRDRIARTTERVSLHADGTEIDSADLGPLAGTTNGVIQGAPQISGNGRYVVFDTPASLLALDTTAWGSWISVQDTYLFDRTTHTTELVSALSDGSAAGGAGFGGVRVSDDGRYVAFGVDSASSRFATSAARTVFVRDRVAGTTTEYPEIGMLGGMSGDGRFLLGFANDGVGSSGSLVVVDRATHAMDRVDVTSTGTPAANCLGTFGTVITWENPVSTDGRYVAFVSCAWNLIPGRTGPGSTWSVDTRVYLRDRLLGTTTLIGDPATAASRGVLDLSGDAAKLAQVTASGGTVRDLVTGATDTYSVPGEYLDDPVEPDALSSDGRFVVFTSGVGPRFEVYVKRIG